MPLANGITSLGAHVSSVGLCATIRQNLVFLRSFYGIGIAIGIGIAVFWRIDFDFDTDTDFHAVGLMPIPDLCFFHAKPTSYQRPGNSDAR
jgi:hypothetical protein